MHDRFYNEAIFAISLRPRTPLLIKAGGEGASALDPTVPDMNFVRTRRPGGVLEVYVPGSSLRGVVRSHAERLIRSVNPIQACDPTDTRGAGRLLRECGGNKERLNFNRAPKELNGPQAYGRSCYACRLFGNTALAGRVRVGDLYGQDEGLLERRYGVAIDRVTGAVAQGPFEIETLTDAVFEGIFTVRNFTLGQLGLVAAALLDLSDGLVPIGYGKSRGLGRVSLIFRRFAVRTLRDPAGRLLGAGALRQGNDGYDLPANDEIAWDAQVVRVRGFYEAAIEAAKEDDARPRALLEDVAQRWPDEVRQ